MPTAPVTPPASGAPVHAPSRIPGFLLDIVSSTAHQYAPAVGAKVAESLNNLLKKSNQPPLTLPETNAVQGVVVMVITRSVGALRNV